MKVLAHEKELFERAIGFLWAVACLCLAKVLWTPGTSERPWHSTDPKVVTVCRPFWKRF